MSGVEQYDTEDIEDIFDSENLLTYPKLYAPFMDGGKLNIYPQEEYDTPEQKLNAGLVRMADKDKLRTSNKKIISFVNAMLKYAFDENDVFDEDELSDNEEIIASTKKATGSKCSLCWKVSENPCKRKSCPKHTE